MSDPHNHLVSFRTFSYSPNQLLTLDFLTTSHSKMALAMWPNNEIKLFVLTRDILTPFLTTDVIAIEWSQKKLPLIGQMSLMELFYFLQKWLSTKVLFTDGSNDKTFIHIFCFLWIDSTLLFIRLRICK